MDTGTVIAILGALLTGLLAWLGKYHVGRLDKTISRVDDIRERYVTREEFENYVRRLEEISQGRHDGNVTWLRRIEDTMNANAAEAKRDRHAAANALNAIGIQVAELIGAAKAQRQNERRP